MADGFLKALSDRLLGSFQPTGGSLNGVEAVRLEEPFLLAAESEKSVSSLGRGGIEFELQNIGSRDVVLGEPQIKPTAHRKSFEIEVTRRRDDVESERITVRLVPRDFDVKTRERIVRYPQVVVTLPTNAANQPACSMTVNFSIPFPKFSPAEVKFDDVPRFGERLIAAPDGLPQRHTFVRFARNRGEAYKLEEGRGAANERGVVVRLDDGLIDYWFEDEEQRASSKILRLGLFRNIRWLTVQNTSPSRISIEVTRTPQFVSIFPVRTVLEPATTGEIRVRFQSEGHAATVLNDRVEFRILKQSGEKWQAVEFGPESVLAVQVSGSVVCRYPVAIPRLREIDFGIRRREPNVHLDVPLDTFGIGTIRARLELSPPIADAVDQSIMLDGKSDMVNLRVPFDVERHLASGQTKFRGQVITDCSIIGLRRHEIEIGIGVEALCVDPLVFEIGTCFGESAALPLRFIHTGGAPTRPIIDGIERYEGERGDLLSALRLVDGYKRGEIQPVVKVVTKRGAAFHERYGKSRVERVLFIAAPSVSRTGEIVRESFTVRFRDEASGHVDLLQVSLATAPPCLEVAILEDELLDAALFTDLRVVVFSIRNRRTKPVTLARATLERDGREIGRETMSLVIEADAERSFQMNYRCKSRRNWFRRRSRLFGRRRAVLRLWVDDEFQDLVVTKIDLDG